ncbi:MAG TPA: PilZ domain-containing protein [Thermodesulfobacteriota bacterium]|jgi:c-di-GMP-binding flagellar brake protein YcgR|nr:PilZ domain-containing protein [Thermodesulfobacteriota bacterium]
MDMETPHEERRKYPRASLDLPVDYRVMNVPYAHGGLVVNASEMGLLINSVKDILIGSKLNIAVLFPKGFQLTNFEASAEIIWKDYHQEENWEGYRYGLKFTEILEEDRKKLKQLLSAQFPSSKLSPHP